MVIPSSLYTYKETLKYAVEPDRRFAARLSTDAICGKCDFFCLRFDLERSALETPQTQTHMDTYIHTHTHIYIYICNTCVLSFLLNSSSLFWPASGSRRQRPGHAFAFFSLLGWCSCFCERYRLCFFRQPPLPCASHRPSA